MQIVVHVKKKLPIDADDITKKIRNDLEMRIEDIPKVQTANFDHHTLKVYIEYKMTEEEEENPDIDKSTFRHAVDHSKYFAFVSMSM